MTNLLARILLAVMLLPLAAVVYLVVLFTVMGNGPNRGAEEIGFFLATITTAIFVAVYWLRLWRDSVNWTQARTRRTYLSGFACIGGGILMAVVMRTLAGIKDYSFFYFIAGLIAVVTWLPFTVIIWKETPLEQAERIRQAGKDVLSCPRCGYNLTGLSQARCPECGAQYTLNQLYSAQKQPEIADAATTGEERQQGFA